MPLQKRSKTDQGNEAAATKPKVKYSLAPVKLILSGKHLFWLLWSHCYNCCYPCCLCCLLLGKTELPKRLMPIAQATSYDPKSKIASKARARSRVPPPASLQPSWSVLDNLKQEELEEKARQFEDDEAQTKADRNPFSNEDNNFYNDDKSLGCGRKMENPRLNECFFCVCP